MRKQGVSSVDSGTVPGVLAVAAPIFGVDGQVVAAVSTGGPTSRVADHLSAVKAAVLDAAEDISRILGYRGGWPKSQT